MEYSTCDNVEMLDVLAAIAILEEYGGGLFKTEIDAIKEKIDNMLKTKTRPSG